MHTSAATPIRRAMAIVIGAVAIGGPATVGATAADYRAAGGPAGLAVSYTAPPPTLVLTPYASVDMPVEPDRGSTIPGVAVLPEGGAIVIDRDAELAFLVGADGSTSPAPALDAYPTSIVATAGPVIYGFIVTEDGAGYGLGAIALAGPNAGRVVASGPVPDPSLYLEVPVGVLGNAPGGVIDRLRAPGTLMLGHVDASGAPVTIAGLRGPLTITDDNLVADPVSPDHQWQLAIERHPEASGPYAGESPPAPGADGTSVYWTAIGPPSQPSEPLSPALQPVIAVLQPDGTGQWYSIPDGWSAVASDVGGTLFARRVDGGDTVELARMDISATGPAPAPIPALSAQCDDYEFNDAYPLRLCDSGEAVRLAQTALSSVDPDLAADGHFGPLTERAVRTFQAQEGLDVDGLVGRDTWAALTADLAVGTDGDGNGVIDPRELGPERAYYWVVVVAASPNLDDPVIDQAMADVAAAGFVSGVAITGCEVGSPEALGHPSGEVVVSIQFPSEASALAGQALLAARGVTSAVAYVSSTCAH